MTTRRRLREAKRRRSRRIRALLAAGAVFGVGAAGTLAAWNDSVFATASLTAGVFGIEGAPDGSTFSEHDDQSPAALSFGAQPASALYPGATVYTLFSVRTIDDSVAGWVQVRADAGNTGVLANALTYGLRTIGSTSCNQASFDGGSVLVANGSSMTTGSTAWQTLDADGGNQVNYCIAITMNPSAPNDVQSASGALLWEFYATTDAP